MGFWTARKAPLFLPENYKGKTNRTVEGRARTGEVSKQGLVAHTEHWDGRITGQAAPSAIRYVREPDGRIRPMTFKEMVEKGYFIVKAGPKGVRSL